MTFSRAPTITYYTPLEWMRRTGRLCDGGVVPDPELLFQKIRIADIQRSVSQAFGTPLREMVSARRARESARPRQAAMYLARELTGQSLPEIGRRFGNRDHTTVIHAIKRVEQYVREDVEFREKLIEAAEALA